MRVQAAAAVHGGNLWAVARSRGIALNQIVDFSADLNPWAQGWVPAAVVEQAWQQICHYPDPAYRRLREAAAAWEGVSPENILPGNGTADLIHLISRWRRGSRAVIPVPTFTEYARAIRADGGMVTGWPLPEEKEFRPEAFPGFLRETEAGIVFICNPNNPTGRVWPPERVADCLKLCERKGALLVVDEAYMDLVPDGRRYSLAPETDRCEHLLVLRSLTKSFGVPGLRVGYAVGHPAVVESLQAVHPPWSLNTLAGEVGAWLLSSAAEKLADSRRRLESARVEMARSLDRLDLLHPFPSDANFLLCRVHGAQGVGMLADRLEERGIMIRRCDDFEGLEPDRFLRVAIRRPQENQRLADALGEILRHAG